MASSNFNITGQHSNIHIIIITNSGNNIQVDIFMQIHRTEHGEAYSVTLTGPISVRFHKEDFVIQLSECSPLCFVSDR